MQSFTNIYLNILDVIHRTRNNCKSKLMKNKIRESGKFSLVKFYIKNKY